MNRPLITTPNYRLVCRPIPWHKLANTSNKPEDHHYIVEKKGVDALGAERWLHCPTELNEFIDEVGRELLKYDRSLIISADPPLLTLINAASYTEVHSKLAPQAPQDFVAHPHPPHQLKHLKEIVKSNGEPFDFCHSGNVAEEDRPKAVFICPIKECQQIFLQVGDRLVVPQRILLNSGWRYKDDA